MGDTVIEKQSTKFSDPNARKMFVGAMAGTKHQFALDLARYKNWFAKIFDNPEDALKKLNPATITRIAKEWTETGTFEFDGVLYDRKKIVASAEKQIKKSKPLMDALPALGKLFGIGEKADPAGMLPDAEVLNAPSRMLGEAVEENSTFGSKMGIAFRALFRDPLGTIMWFIKAIGSFIGGLFSKDGFQWPEPTDAMKQIATDRIIETASAKFQAARASDPRIEVVLGNGNDQKILAQARAGITKGLSGESMPTFSDKDTEKAVADVTPLPLVTDLSKVNPKDLQAIVTEGKKMVSTMVQNQLSAFVAEPKGDPKTPENAAKIKFWNDLAKKQGGLAAVFGGDSVRKTFAGMLAANSGEDAKTSPDGTSRTNSKRIGDFIGDSIVQIFRNTPEEKIRALAKDPDALADYVGTELKKEMKKPENLAKWRPLDKGKPNSNVGDAAAGELADNIGDELTKLIKSKKDVIAGPIKDHVDLIIQLQKAFKENKIAFHIPGFGGDAKYVAVKTEGPQGRKAAPTPKGNPPPSAQPEILV